MTIGISGWILELPTKVREDFTITERVSTRAFAWLKASTSAFKFKTLIKMNTQGGEGRISEAENLRSSSQIQSIFNLLGRTGKNIIFIIRVGI